MFLVHAERGQIYSNVLRIYGKCLETLVVSQAMFVTLIVDGIFRFFFVVFFFFTCKNTPFCVKAVILFSAFGATSVLLARIIVDFWEVCVSDGLRGRICVALHRRVLASITWDRMKRPMSAWK